MAILNFVLRGKHTFAFLWFITLFPAFAVAEALTAKALSPQLELQLSNGQTVLLAGIVPAAKHTYLPESWRAAPVYFEPAYRDRYGRAHGWLYRASDGALLQNALLAQSSAMAYWPSQLILPKTFKHSAKTPTLARFSADDAHKAIGRWAQVEGVAREVTQRRRAVYINFGENWRDDFTLYLPKRTFKQFDEAALQALKGKHLRMRGFVHAYYGPRITLFNPQMMEIIAHEPLEPHLTPLY